MQWIQCRFGPTAIAYTYRNDGDDVAVGDEVMVPARGGVDRRVEVVAILDEEPQVEFGIKSITGKAPPREPQPEAVQ